jgi:hypothetical protein
MPEPGSFFATLPHVISFSPLPLCPLARIVLLLLVPTMLKAAPAPDTLVAVGYGGRRMISTNGLTWTAEHHWGEVGKDDENNLMSVAASTDGHILVAAGGGGQGLALTGRLVLSTDHGQTWRELARQPFRAHPVVFGHDRFVVGIGGPTLLVSTDGEHWQPGASLKPAVTPAWAFWFRSGAYGNGTFVFLGNHGREQKGFWSAASPDGTTITGINTGLPRVKGLAFGAGHFVTVGPAGTRLHSTDGLAWTRTQDAVTEDLLWIVWDGRQFLTGGKTNTYASADGLSWAIAGPAAPGNIIHADAHRRLATAWPGKLWLSRDNGHTWQSCTSPQPALALNRILALPTP